MTDGLSARQIQILKSLVDEYIQTAEPVGSSPLEKKYSLGISPATIRNEMSSLTRLGFLRQPHTSAGRVPTPKAMKFYVDQLMEEKQMSVADEVKAKEDVWDTKNNLNDLMNEATNALAEQTKNLAVGTMEDGRTWLAGYSNVFSNPEFANLQVCANLFSLLEEADRIHELFFEKAPGLSPIEIIFGEELGWVELATVGIVTAHFNVQGKNGALGVIGPMRLSYPTIIPTVRYFKSLIEEVSAR